MTESGSPTSFQNRSENGDDDRGQSSLNITTAAIANDITGDDFDDFEEGEEGAAGDDFGDFDDGFHDANVTEHTGTSELPELPLPSFVSSISLGSKTKAIIKLLPKLS